MNYFDIISNVAKERGYTMKRLEREIGLSDGAIYKWKTTTPGIDKLVSAAKILDCSMDELLGIKKEPADGELDEQIVQMIKILSSLPEEKLQRVKDFLAGISGS